MSHSLTLKKQTLLDNILYEIQNKENFNNQSTSK